jgi:DNA-binding MarR family transcriptional regulator
MSSRGSPTRVGEAYSLATLIARSRRLVWRTAHRRLEGKGRSMLVWQVLNCLRRSGPLSQSELALRTGQHATGLSRMLAGLEDEGTVVRRRQEGDHRRVQVELSALAAEQFALMDPDVESAAEQVFAPLSPEERRTLEALLSKLVEADDGALSR